MLSTIPNREFKQHTDKAKKQEETSHGAVTKTQARKHILQQEFKRMADSEHYLTIQQLFENIKSNFEDELKEQNGKPSFEITYQDIASWLLDYDFYSCSYMFDVESLHDVQIQSDVMHDFYQHDDHYFILYNELIKIEESGVIPESKLLFNTKEATHSYQATLEDLLDYLKGNSDTLPEKIERTKPDVFLASSVFSEYPTLIRNLQDEISRLKSTQPQNESKQANYNSPPQTLQLANQAFSKFWGNAAPLEKDTQPNNSDISKWIIKQSGGKITQTMADKIAQIIRPEWAATGRKPEK
ncbi:hypothetical protein [uncultured Neisseria sp.]|uniref:hypothetical protein n=1 Tax=uncultured Neisseria sp. TaxID=237778 RepID=UPI0025CF35BA|nr:hypothetical protein [uncultured Neisseria sp.]